MRNEAYRHTQHKDLRKNITVMSENIKKNNIHKNDGHNEVKGN